MVSDYATFSADGYQTGWTTWNGGDAERLNLDWDNEAWTVSGKVGGADIEYVIRLSPQWEVRQFMLFRDLAEPDLWLGTDGSGRWGEVNGAHRTDLDGAFDVHLDVSPFPLAIPIRRLPIAVGTAADITVLDIDVETLGVVTRPRRLERLSERRWRVTDPDRSIEFDVDEYGLPHDLTDRFRRVESG